MGPARVAGDLPGALWIMPCPVDAEAIGRLRDIGIDSVVSLLTAADAADLGMADEAALCAGNGLTFLNFPIVDYGLPDADGFATFVRAVALRLRNGACIAVHCRAGIGRSGMLCACLLIALGWSAEAAVSDVSNARGVTIPDTEAQADFIASFEMRRG